MVDFDNISQEITRSTTIDPLIGAIIGDVCGSKYEWHNAKTKQEINLSFDSPSKFTDDTVLSCAVADWLVDSKNGTTPDQEQILKDKLDVYGKAHPNAGYGHIFREWLAMKDKQPMNSYGNGAGMRCSAVACVAKSYEELLSLAKQSAEVTHNHPEGIKGAQALCAAIWSILNGCPDKEYLKREIEHDFGYNLNKTVDEIHGSHKFDATCQVTVPEAIIAFLEGNSFDEVFEKAIWIGGDSDTIADMACALAGAYYGIPDGYYEALQGVLTEDLREVINKFKEYVYGSE